MFPRQLIAVLVTAFAVSIATARDDIMDISIEKAISTDEAKNKLGKRIKFYFGNQKHPKILEELGEFKTNKKTNSFNKGDEAACSHAFLSALLALKNRAVKEGGNAVVEIRSNYRNEESSSETTFKCGSGNVVCGVALIGKIVKIEGGDAK